MKAFTNYERKHNHELTHHCFVTVVNPIKKEYPEIVTKNVRKLQYL
jgi:hypothetical protein